MILADQVLSKPGLSILCKALFGPLTKELAGLVTGLDLIDNIQPLCKRCNRWKGARTIDYRSARRRRSRKQRVNTSADGGQE